MPQATQPVGHSHVTPSSFLTGPTPLGLVSVGFPGVPAATWACVKGTADIPGRNLNPNHPSHLAALGLSYPLHRWAARSPGRGAPAPVTSPPPATLKRDHPWRPPGISPDSHWALQGPWVLAHLARHVQPSSASCFGSHPAKVMGRLSTDTRKPNDS